MGLASQMGFPAGSVVKNPPAKQETGLNPWFRMIPWRREWQPTPIFLPGEFSQTEEPGGLQPMGSQRVGHVLATEQQRQLIRSFLSFFLRNPRTFGLDSLPAHPSGGWSAVDSPVCPGIGGGGCRLGAGEKPSSPYFLRTTMTTKLKKGSFC